MFQRLKGAIDSRIAEEQARQRSSQTSSSRSNSAARRSSSLADSPRRTSRARERRDIVPTGKGPDPAEFEPEFVVGDDEDPSRAATPKPEGEKEEKGTEDNVAGEQKPLADGGTDTTTVGETSPKPLTELPTEVRVKLRKLDKLELRYQELLKAYRTAHARVLSIEPFEASLRENTPLTSIADPGALLEYLNQINLKGDMVIDELKRVSAERDEYKKKLEDAEKSARQAWDEVAGLKKDEKTEALNGLNGARSSLDSNTTGEEQQNPTPQKSPATSPKIRTPSIASLSLFSPKSKPVKSPPVTEQSEEFFSYDSELPRLESELKERQDEVTDLKSQLLQVKGDLSVARESTEGMVQSLEAATRELNTLRDGRDRHEEECRGLKKTIQEKEAQFDHHIKQTDEEKRTAQLAHEALKVQALQNGKEIEGMTAERTLSQKKIDTLTSLIDNLRTQLNDAESTISSLKAEIEACKSTPTSTEDHSEQAREIETDEGRVDQLKDRELSVERGTSTEALSQPDKQPTDAATTSKKKNKKKKKGKSGPANNTDAPKQALDGSVTETALEDGIDSSNTVKRLQAELETLQAQLLEKDVAIERIMKKIKDQDAMQEEIETLRDDLVNVGQEHVEAKDRVKVLMAEKSALEESTGKLEAELSEIRTSTASTTAGSEKAHSDLIAELEDVKSKSTSLQTDLSVAQQLAASRFKDLTELRDILQKVQPEVKGLKSDLEEARGFKEKFNTKSNELRRLEARHEDLQSEMKGVKSSITDRDAEIKTLNQKISQETNNRLKAEEALGVAESDLRYSESKKQEAIESNERTARDLARAQEDLRSSRARLDSLEDQVAQVGKEAEKLREELQLKTAQHASAQSLMSSMRDQTSEMAMQVKEARERCESLEEELGESQRMLSERSREGETMRRLLSEVEGRADSKLREMKERMDTAIEERDRAEDEASTVARKRSREVEELKGKVRETEKALQRIEEDKDELERLQKDWKRRREELEGQTERSTSEISDIRQAMTELRDALDDSERQSRELEKERTDLRKNVEDAQARIEKLQKSNRSLAEEVRTLKKPNSTVPSSRSSIDSRVGSPSPRNPSAVSKEPSTGAAVDYVYLKNVLLQFLEQRDKNHQKQLIPVLAMLLHFDRSDEQKWMSAITAR